MSSLTTMMSTPSTISGLSEDASTNSFITWNESTKERRRRRKAGAVGERTLQFQTLHALAGRTTALKPNQPCCDREHSRLAAGFMDF